MATAAELRARRDALTAQRSSGVARVSYDGKTVDYRSVAEIDRAIEALDTRVYARAAAWIAGVDRWPEARWADLEAQLGVAKQGGPTDGTATAPSVPTRTVPRRRTVRSSYMR